LSAQKLPPEDHDTGTVRAVVRAIDILKSFDGKPGELLVSEIQKRVRLSRPTLYRLLNTLVETGMLRVAGEPQRFRLGRTAARLGQIWAASVDVSAAARPFLDQLRDETGETAALFVLRDDRLFCAHEARSRHALAVSRGVGEIRSGLEGASGRAILAWLDSDRAQALRAHYAHPGELKTSDADLAGIRSAGYAISRGAVFDGAMSLAAPIFDLGGKVIGSLGLCGPEARMDDAQLPATIELVKRAAASLSAELGAPGATSSSRIVGQN
jgi:DNA-binding IclR family transcriptional regulator